MARGSEVGGLVLEVLRFSGSWDRRSRGAGVMPVFVVGVSEVRGAGVLEVRGFRVLWAKGPEFRRSLGHKVLRRRFERPQVGGSEVVGLEVQMFPSRRSPSRMFGGFYV